MSIPLQLPPPSALESLGVAAADIAHDLDHVMTAVIGYGEILAARPGASDQNRRDALEIQLAGQQGALLAHELRTLSCVAPPASTEIDINTLVESVRKSARALLRDGVSVTCDVASVPALARVDWDQVRLALVTLALTAQAQLRRGCVHMEISVRALLTPGPVTVRVRISGRSLDGDYPPPVALGDAFMAASAIVHRNGGTVTVDRRAGGIVHNVAFPVFGTVARSMPALNPPGSTAVAEEHAGCDRAQLAEVCSIVDAPPNVWEFPRVHLVPRWRAAHGTRVGSRERCLPWGSPGPLVRLDD